MWRRAALSKGEIPHEAVDAGLGLEPAVGVGAGNLVGDRADAGLLARALGDELDLHAVAFGPPDVHAGEHRRPVAALGAAGAGVDLEEGVVAVGLAVEQRLDLALRRLLAQAADRRLGVGDNGLVALGLGELDHLALVGEFALQRMVLVQRVGERLAVAHQPLRPRRVVPELRVLRHGVELFQPVGRGFPPQPLPEQRQRTLDVLDHMLGFGTHGGLLCAPRRRVNAPARGRHVGSTKRPAMRPARPHFCRSSRCLTLLACGKGTSGTVSRGSRRGSASCRSSRDPWSGGRRGGRRTRRRPPGCAGASAPCRASHDLPGSRCRGRRSARACGDGSVPKCLRLLANHLSSSRTVRMNFASG